MNESSGSNPNFITGSKNGGPSMVANTPAPTNPTVQPGQGGNGGNAQVVAEATGNAVGTLTSGMLSGGFSYLSRYEDGLDFAMSAVANSSSARLCKRQEFRLVTQFLLLFSMGKGFLIKVVADTVQDMEDTEDTEDTEEDTPNFWMLVLH